MKLKIIFIPIPNVSIFIYLYLFKVHISTPPFERRQCNPSAPQPFYINYDGTYPSDYDELMCRIKNQEIILNNANHVIKISKDVISNKNTSSSAKQKQIKKGLVKIDEAVNQWKKISSEFGLKF